MRRILSGCLVLLAVALAACGDDDSGGDDAAAAGTPAAESAVSAEVQESVERGFEGTDEELPTESPKPAKDVKVWIVACTLEGEGCARPAEAAADAAKELGWEATVADGKLDPNEQANQIRNGISAGADVIVPLSIACDTVPGAFQAAKDAGREALRPVRA